MNRPFEIKFKNGSIIQAINYGGENNRPVRAKPYDQYNYDDLKYTNISWGRSYEGQQEYLFKLKLQLCETSNPVLDFQGWRSPPAISTETYGVSCRNLEIDEGDIEMRVLFVKSEDYNQICEWYDGLNEVQKHRKVVAICKSPDQFREQFNIDKFGAQYTTFYFETWLPAKERVEYCKLFVDLYGADTAQYIMKNKMRSIYKTDLLNNNAFDIFRSFILDDDLIEHIVNYKPFMCKNLL